MNVEIVEFFFLVLVSLESPIFSYYSVILFVRLKATKERLEVNVEIVEFVFSVRF